MALGHITVRYRIRQFDGTFGVFVEGVKIGRFAVREIRLEERNAWDIHNYPWIVDHIPSGGAVATAPTFADAMQIVDDVSRFSVKDPSSRDPQRVRRQIGERLGEWLRARLLGQSDQTSFREWLKEK